MRLVATSGDQTLAFPLRQGSTLIGRHASCHVCIPAKGISRRHCQVYVDGTTAVVRDLGSANNTFVNNRRVTDRVELRDGDVLCLGTFELRFELGEGAPAAAYGAPAGAATQDIEVDAGPAHAASPHAAEPYPDEPPPAPSDFRESPEPDDTPVDAAFVPQPYAGPPQGEPGAQAVGGPSTALVVSGGVPLQPQLVVRDGRWYLRDPRTGREVEISPKAPGEGAAAAIAAPPAALRRPNVRLLLAVVAVAVIAVVGFAAIFLKPPPPPTGFAISKEAYNRIVDEAVKKVRANEIEPALKTLDRAEEARKDIGVARLVAQFVRLKQSTPLDDKFPWRQARTWLESLKDIGSASDEVLAYVDEQLNWIDREQTLLGSLSETLARLRNVAPADVDSRIEIYRELAKFQAGYVASKPAQAEAVKLRAEIAKHYLDRARQAEAGRAWADAVAQYQKALGFVDDRSPAQKQIATCQQAAADQSALEKGRTALGQDNFPAARAALGAIQTGSPYHADAQALLAQIAAAEKNRERTRLVAQARNLWKSGNAPEALKLAEEHGLQELAEVKPRFEEWQRLMAQAEDALKAKDYVKAQQTFDQAAAVPGDPDNAYAQQAKGRSQGVRDGYPQYAKDFADEAYLLLDADPRQARALLEKALTYQKGNERAKKGLDLLHRNAALRYREGSDLVRQGLFANARRVLEEAELRAQPGSELHNSIRQALDECKKALEPRP
jgi:hypothetical protein